MACLCCFLPIRRSIVLSGTLARLERHMEIESPLRAVIKARFLLLRFRRTVNIASKREIRVSLFAAMERIDR
jgi:hypothetical protein